MRGTSEGSDEGERVVSDRILAYKLSRPDISNDWMFAGTTPQEAANVLRCELESCDGGDVDDVGEIVIEAFWITQAEIENMGEFEGW